MARSKLISSVEAHGITSDPGAVWLAAGAADATSGPDTLNGTSGPDTIDGLAGDDVIHGLDGNDMLFGGADADQLFGDGGNDYLDGGTGVDVMNGGAGDDIYRVDTAADSVTEAVGEGFDTIYASVSYILAAGSEVEILSVNDHNATTAINFTGNGFANYLYGNNGANVLDGGAGNDVMLGFGGNDTFYVNSVGDYVFEAVNGGFDTIYASSSFGLDPNSEVEVLSANDYNATTAINFNGNQFNNRLYGNAGANVLDGGGGDDILIGFGGGDTLIGGQGSDTYVLSGGEGIVETAGQGFDIIYANFSYALAANLEIELLTAQNRTATTAIDFTGNDFDNTLYGNNGANILYGGGGVDRMIGFGGNDTYYVDNSADFVGEDAENSGTGFDTIYTSVTYALSSESGVEVLSVNNHSATVAIDLTGNRDANYLYGNAGANVLDGRGGADVLLGFAGADTFVFSTAINNNDTVRNNVDYLGDFEHGIDKIALDDAVFAQIGALGALDPNAFHIGTAAHDGSDRILYDSSTGRLYYDLDGDLGAAPVLFATFNGTPTLSASDFQVI